MNLDVGKYMVKVSSPGPSSDALITGVPLGAMYQTLTMLSITMGIGSVAVMIGTGFLGSFVIRRTMKPLERVSGVATEVARLNLESDTIAPEVRVTPKDANPRTEVGSVGYALNQLLDNVSSALDVRERTEKQIRAFIADASHELRTPLAAIKGYSDMLRWTEPLADGGQSSLARIDSQTERMSRLVEDLLLLAPRPVQRGYPASDQHRKRGRRHLRNRRHRHRANQDQGQNPVSGRVPPGRHL